MDLRLLVRSTFLLGNIKLSTWNKLDVYMVIPLLMVMTRQVKRKQCGTLKTRKTNVHDMLFKALTNSIDSRIGKTDKAPGGFMNKKESSKRNIVIGLC